MANNVDWFYFHGKGSWAGKLTVPDMDYRCWSVKLHLHPDSVAQFNELKQPSAGVEGILNELKQDDDGYYHVFRRPTVKEWRDKSTGRMVEQALTPPIILDNEGKPWDGRGIGNGSDLTVKVERYKYNVPRKKDTKGTAIRLVSVMVNNLVPYDRKDFTPAEEKQAQGLTEVTKPNF